MAEDWIPSGLDLGRPSAARIYDYLLGGGHNFAVDREFAERAIAAHPGARDLAQLNRAFLYRAVGFLVSQGVRQFLDLGSGIPTRGNVHEIAQSAAPGSRVVYVDYEDVAVAHTQLLLRHNDNAEVVHADAADVDKVLSAPATQRLLDFSQPVGVLAMTLFHYFSPEQDPFGVAARYRDAVPSGSYFALTHLTDHLVGAATGEITERMRGTRDSVYVRDVDDIGKLFGDFDLVEPGLVRTWEWRPETHLGAGPPADGDWLCAGVARKP
ncbi:SAM-dependent methyltransferase [Crossiella cryophila]|uniref:S-adenosyl methyltransferase n=1 Tax=Crossiella cryophila TaxID=43355 RepID=A0A7W7CFH0_9PSEU|nr:SAM-dependent methyltransferase [Crossiella cryophila]MBB4680262.1 hypothetical protein [Crossiella cryophila]